MRFLLKGCGCGRTYVRCFRVVRKKQPKPKIKSWRLKKQGFVHVYLYLMRMITHFFLIMCMCMIIYIYIYLYIFINIFIYIYIYIYIYLYIFIYIYIYLYIFIYIYIYLYIYIYIFTYINGDVWFWRLLSSNITFSGWKWCFYRPLENMMGQNTKIGKDVIWQMSCRFSSDLRIRLAWHQTRKKNHGNSGVLRHVLRWPLYSPDPRAHIKVQHDSFVISMIRRDSSYFAVLIVKKICGLKKLG